MDERTDQPERPMGEEPASDEQPEPTQVPAEEPLEDPIEDEVEEASDDSFPASDPPSFTRSTASSD